MRAAFTLMEILLVIGILAALMALLVPPVIRGIEESRMPESAKRLRSMLRLTRAHAAFDGKRYRIRFPAEDEIDSGGDVRQPIIERENDPLREPEVFTRVKAVWAEGETLLRGVRCVEVRLGKPNLQEMMSGDTSQHELLVEELADDVEEDVRPPLYIEPDGTSEWATFVITNAPDDAGDRSEDLEDFERIEVILDGFTGLAWLQRPFFDEELEMLAANNWPPVLRRDFLSPRVLTEADVIEIQESLIRKR